MYLVLVVMLLEEDLKEKAYPIRFELIFAFLENAAQPLYQGYIYSFNASFRLEHKSFVLSPGSNAIAVS